MYQRVETKARQHTVQAMPAKHLTCCAVDTLWCTLAFVLQILLSALTLPQDHYIYASMPPLIICQAPVFTRACKISHGLIVCGNCSAHSPHLGVCHGYKQAKYMCDKSYCIWNETAAARVVKRCCQSIWFPWLVMAINRCLIPERALPDIHRVVALDCFASLQNIIYHQVSVSALCRHHAGQHRLISGNAHVVCTKVCHCSDVPLPHVALSVLLSYSIVINYGSLCTSCNVIQQFFGGMFH